MGTPFLAELRMISFNFAPKGWALANGQTLPINQNQALFAILGTTYGGNGQTTFALPDLRGRVPIHIGGQVGATLGQKGGELAHTVSISEMPAHNHTVKANNGDPNVGAPAGAAWCKLAGEYGGVSSLTTFNPQSISNTGGSQPHNNLAPYLVINIIIALQGVFPSQN